MSGNKDSTVASKHREDPVCHKHPAQVLESIAMNPEFLILDTQAHNTELGLAMRGFLQGGQDICKRHKEVEMQRHQRAREEPLMNSEMVAVVHMLRYSRTKTCMILFKFWMVGRSRFCSLSSNVCHTEGNGVGMR